MSEQWQSTDGLKSGSTSFGQVQSSQTVYVRTNQTRTVTATFPDGGSSVAVSTAGRMTSAARYATNGTVVNSVNYGFDVQGRQASVTDSRNGTSQMSFNVADLAMSMTTPAPGNGQPAQTSSTEYDTSLRARRSTQPDGTTVTNEYFVTGALKKTYGSRTYPVEDT